MRREKIETDELLPPRELGTLFIDVKNKKFLINGEEFGKRCKSITIRCNPPEWEFRVIIDRPIEFRATFDSNGKEKNRTLSEIR